MIGVVKKLIDGLVCEYNMWKDIILIGQPFSGMVLILVFGISILVVVCVLR